MRKNVFILQIMNIIAYIGMVAINILANVIPIGGNTTGEVAEMYPNLFTPANITFSIWGVIYILLGGFVIYQGRDLFSNKKKNQYFVDQISWWFVVSCAANFSWILAWHYREIPISVILMLVLLFSLLKIYQNLNVGRVVVPKRIRFFVHAPFQIYLGWITIATIANFTTLFVYLGWDGFGASAVIWTISMLIIGTLITRYVLVNKRDTLYSLVILWSYLGIVIKRLGAEVRYSSIIVTAILCMAVIVFYLTPREGREIN
ncbi:tryptophan-rich sensory protein [Alkaliphilus hydrothermalis]|uniref:Tryptophan-rich sensory protein n=1 Tax=Alkaliphilus hydrothermalis TaxID=1482730 RepID=A0ABS2NTU4_9FIRM|nr:tryptophan-rich sensory protein [Alkaliphilus hydrothermalis]MBM7616363.1 hypothetical protein [Alkaliphilus hydrothermalis]